MTSPRVLRRRIPSSGEEIPVVGLGTWQTFDVGSKRAARERLEGVLAAFEELGGALVDSSPMYGSSEEVVGDLAVALDVQPKLFLATKVWTEGKQDGIDQMMASMRKLRTTRVDLMQVHNLVDVRTHLDTLHEWKRECRVRYVGVTHYTASGHDAIANVMASAPIDFVQINYSVAEPEAETKVLPLALDRGIAVIANRPFANGALLRRLRHKPLPSWAADIQCDSWAEVLLKFVVSHPAVTCVIPATSDAMHLVANMAAARGSMPDESLRKRIAADVGRS